MKASQLSAEHLGAVFHIACSNGTKITARLLKVEHQAHTVAEGTLMQRASHEVVSHCSTRLTFAGGIELDVLDGDLATATVVE